MTSDRRTEVVEVQLPDGNALYAEVEVPGGGDARWGSERQFSLEDIRTSVISIGPWIYDTVRRALPDAPDKIGVEFGLKLTAKSGPLVAALAEVGGEASVVVKLEWARSPEEAKSEGKAEAS